MGSKIKCSKIIVDSSIFISSKLLQSFGYFVKIEDLASVKSSFLAITVVHGNCTVLCRCIELQAESFITLVPITKRWSIHVLRERERVNVPTIPKKVPRVGFQFPCSLDFWIFSQLLQSQDRLRRCILRLISLHPFEHAIKLWQDDFTSLHPWISTETFPRSIWWSTLEVMVRRRISAVGL